MRFVSVRVLFVVLCLNVIFITCESKFYQEGQCTPESVFLNLSDIEQLPLPALPGFFSVTTNPSDIFKRKDLRDLILHFAKRYFIVEIWSYVCVSEDIIKQINLEFKAYPNVHLILRESLVPQCTISCSLKIHKYTFAKLRLNQNHASRFSFIFLWDDDIQVSDATFDATLVLKHLTATNAEAAQPSLSSLNGRVTGIYRPPPVFAQVENPEIMVPIYSALLWQCLWYLLTNRANWGLDLEGSSYLCNCKRGFIYTQFSIVHLNYRSMTSTPFDFNHGRHFLLEEMRVHSELQTSMGALGKPVAPVVLAGDVCLHASDVLPRNGIVRALGSKELKWNDDEMYPWVQYHYNKTCAK